MIRSFNEVFKLSDDDLKILIDHLIQLGHGEYDYLYWFGVALVVTPEDSRSRFKNLVRKDLWESITKAFRPHRLSDIVIAQFAIMNIVNQLKEEGKIRTVI